jgi:predicted lipoprotein with Yx(FWY)xxD motif
MAMLTGVITNQIGLCWIKPKSGSITSLSWEDKWRIMMKQQKLSRVTLMGTFLIILSLGLAACAPAASPTAGIPVTGGTGTPPVGGSTLPASTLPATTGTPMVSGTQMTTTGTPMVSGTQMATTGTPAASGGTPMVIGMKNSPSLGNYLVDDKGMTLYVFKNDTAGTSACNGNCATIWPPLSAQAAPTGGTGVTGAFGLLTRSDGSQQVTYNNLPLYYFSGDKNPGDTNGQGVGGVWKVAAP